MIAGEEKLLTVQQGHAAGRVAWDGDSLKVGGELQGIGSVYNPFGSRHCIGIGSMDDPLRAKVRGVLVRIGHIVFVRQKDVRDTASPFKEFDQMFDVAGGIDEPITVRMLDKKLLAPNDFSELKPQ